MKILHTSDWHLGMSIEGVSRKEEQQNILNEICFIAEDKNVDIVLICGDIFCGANTPAFADEMFADVILRLSAGGRRAVIAIGGNHDANKRFTASSQFALKQNIFLLNSLVSDFNEEDFLKTADVKLTDYGKGYLTFEKGKEKAVVAYMPYVANFFAEERTKPGENSLLKTKRLFELSSTGFRDDAFNIAAAHAFVPFKDVKENFYIELNESIFPEQANYVALGHIHDFVEIDEDRKIYYSGSPTQIYENESSSKYVIVLNVENNNLKNKEIVKIKSSQKIVSVFASSFEEARAKLIKLENAYVKITFKQDNVSADEIKKLREEFPLVVSLVIVPKSARKKLENLVNKQADSAKIFDEFYKKTYGKLPSSDVKNCFLDLMREEGEENEIN